MRISSSIILIDGVYNATVDLASGGFTPVEAEAVYQHGEPSVACGGVFNNNVNLTFTLPANDRQFPSQFPVKQRFAIADYANASARAELWRSTIKTRLDTAITTLRNISVSNIGEEIANIDTSN